MLFEESKKYFSKFWLQDCIIDIHDTRIPEKDAVLVYHVNKRALINIATTVGKTDDIHLKDIVKQVTKYGPKLCFVATDS